MRIVQGQYIIENEEELLAWLRRTEVWLNALDTGLSQVRAGHCPRANPDLLAEWGITLDEARASYNEVQRATAPYSMDPVRYRIPDLLQGMAQNLDSFCSQASTSGRTALLVSGIFVGLGILGYGLYRATR